MNLQELRKIINEYKYDFINKNIMSFHIHTNLILLKKLNQKYNNFFNNINELSYLINNYDNLENLHIFCNCGNKNKFKSYKIGYNKYCSKKCKANSIEWKNHLKSQKFKDKMKDILLKKYNVINVYQLKNVKFKIKDKLLKKYGVIHNSQIPGNREKAQQTCLKNYGVTHYFKTNQYKNQYKNKEFVLCSQQKRYNSMKKHNSYKKSKQEDNCYQLLLKKFNKDDIERQYKSELYPFASDFYIKSLDLYIECHFGQYHYGRQFNIKSAIDLKEVEELKKKSLELNFKGQRKLQYLNIIETWTKRDTLKLQTFINNKLNYKIFYNKKEFNKWFKSIENNI